MKDKIMHSISQLQLQCSELSRAMKTLNPNDPRRFGIKSKIKALHVQLTQAHHPVAKTETQAETKAELKAEPLTPSHLAFDFYAIPGSQQAAVLVDRVYVKWLAFHPFKRTQSATRLQEYRSIIEGVVSNVLYALAMQRPGVFVSRDEHALAKESRYRPGVYNQKLITVLDDLHAMDILEQVKGDTWRKNPFTGTVIDTAYMRTRLQSAAALEALRATYHVTRPTDIYFETVRQEVVILKKDESSKLEEYTDAERPMAVKYRMQMQIVDRRLGVAGDLLKGEVPGIDQRQRFLVRRFTYSSLESGGRLWGGFWMEMSKAERRELLRIDGRPTIELDFSATIAHLAYIVAGHQETDPCTSVQIQTNKALPEGSP